MSDHGTKVQCPKCNEWVSGSHNCDIWTQECKECEGSGWYCDTQNCSINKYKEKSNICPLKCDYRKPCPHCKGSGGFNLGVRKQCNGHPNIGNPCYCKLYRPLTVAEVEELVKKASLILSDGKDIVTWLKLGAKLETAEGQKISLLPREG